MAYPTIVFNASTGSDTAASGAGPATAESGTGASLNATTSVDLSGDSPDLSGVATDGSACLWVQTSSGRQFSKITAVDNSTKIVTVETTYSVTESSRTWAIGGKRATWDNANSRKLFSADVLPGWIIETETGQTLTGSALTCGVSGDTTNGMIIVRGASTASHPVINQTATAALFSYNSINYWKWSNLKMTCSNATKTYALSLRGVGYVANNVIFGDATNSISTVYVRTGGTVQFMLVNCEVAHCTSNGLYANNGGEVLYAYGCYIHDCGGVGLQIYSGVAANLLVENNTGAGIKTITGTPSISRNTIDANGGDGIDLSTGVNTFFAIYNNNITNNGGYGLRCAAGQETFGLRDFNNFYNNTSGSILNASLATNDLTVDPEYTDAANDDYSIGTNLKAKGFPKFDEPIGINSATYSYVDIGAAQRQESAAGGGVRIPNIRGGADQ